MTSAPARHDEDLALRLGQIRSRIEAACLRAGRDPAEVSLVAVSKTQPPSAIMAAYEAGQRLFGESYVQEWRDKASVLPRDIRWHFIGRVQSNKAKYLADGPMGCVESIDRLAVAERLAARLERQGGREGPLPVLIEVDLSHEVSKGGVEEGALRDLVAAIDTLPALRLEGLMAIPAWHDDPELTRPSFGALARLLGALNASRPAARRLRHLSMGMSDDFEVAIEEGATLVRVGTAIFGARSTMDAESTDT